MPKNERGEEVNDQKVNTNGRSRLLSVGKFVPREWEWVRVTRTRRTPGAIWLRVERLEVNVGV